jgi:hypothetical protein
MPTKKDQIVLELPEGINDLTQIRVPELNKNFGELTLRDLTKLNPGTSPYASSFDVHVASSVGVSSWHILKQLDQIKSIRELKRMR